MRLHFQINSWFDRLDDIVKREDIFCCNYNAEYRILFELVTFIGIEVKVKFPLL